MHLKVPLWICVQKVDSTSHITLHRSLCRGVLHGHLYGLCVSGIHILLYLVDCLRVYEYTSNHHVSCSLLVPPLRCWCPPPRFHIMHCNIAYAQFLCVCLEFSRRSFSECHVCVYMLVLCGCLLNSCIALNSHFECFEYQMSH